MKIDINCDVGEGIQNEHLIMPFISSCNIACGFHSGNPFLIEKTIKSAIKHHVKIGAHPSYHDRENFGRVSMKVESSKLMSELKYQIYAVKGMVEGYGQKLNHVKPHGALYHDMVEDQRWTCRGIQKDLSSRTVSTPHERLALKI